MKRLLQLFLLFVLCLSAWAGNTNRTPLDGDDEEKAQSTLRKHVEHYAKLNDFMKDGSWHRYTVKLNWFGSSPALEKECISFFFGIDSLGNDGSLHKFFDQFFTTFDKKDAYLKHDCLTSQTFSLDTDIRNDCRAGYYRTYYLERRFVTNEKKIVLNRCVIYDEQEDEVLTIDDILKSEFANKIKDFAGDQFIQMRLNNKGFEWAIDHGDVANSHIIQILPNMNLFTERLLKMVDAKGQLAFMEKLQQQQTMTAKNNSLSHERKENSVDSDDIVEELELNENVIKQNDVSVVHDIKNMDDEPVQLGVKVFDVVEQMPEFSPCSYEISVFDPKKKAYKKEVRKAPGGSTGLKMFIADNMKYPTIAEENGIQGRVLCTFIVERDGSITDVQVTRSIDPSLDREAVRVLKKMPRWIPGRQKGSPVRVKYTVPVTFKLN